MATFPVLFTVRYENDKEQHDKLRIPDGFGDVLDDGFLNIQLFINGCHESWYATLVHEECGKGWSTYLDAGWADFVEDNGIEVGDILIFTYLGDSSFTIRIETVKKGKKIQKGKYSEGSSSSYKKRGRRPTVQGSSAKMIETYALLTQLAASCHEEYFFFIFSAAYIQQGVINVPLDFARQHFQDFLDTTDITLQNFDRDFTAQLKITKAGSTIIQCSIKNGVKKFTDQYNVQVDEGALIKFKQGNSIVFDNDLVLV